MKHRFFPCLLACVLWAAVPARAAFDCYLLLDGVPGESTVAGHAGEIVIDAFQMGITRSAGAQASFADLSFTKALDKASPLLMLKCAQGVTIPSAVLTCRTLSTKPVPFYIIRLENVKVTQVTVAGSTGGDPKPTESFSLNYTRIEWEYTPMTPAGGTGAPVRTSWDLSQPPSP